jgi:hypothetical protein
MRGPKAHGEWERKGRNRERKRPLRENEGSGGVDDRKQP